MRGMIAFSVNDSVAGFRLRERLEGRLGHVVTPRYRLRVNVRTRERAAAITSGGDTARRNIIGTANWTLTQSVGGARIETGRVEAFTSYSATGSTVATQSTQDDAEARLAIILADMIVSRVLILTAEQTQ